MGLENKISPSRRARKPSVCSAEVGRFASNPPQLSASLFANLRFALRLGSTTLACRLTPPQKMDPVIHEYPAADELPGIVYGSRK
jgi:hypothetical protein